MRTRTFQHLNQIRSKFGPGVFGKIAQKLLALAFVEAGFPDVVEHGVQGIDIKVVTVEGERYGLEVKTTGEGSISISDENVSALLKAQATDGYAPMIAALRVQMFEDWVFADIPLRYLQPRRLPLSRLRAYRVKPLETSIRPIFEELVNQHFTAVLADGEQYLIDVLKERRERTGA